MFYFEELDGKKILKSSLLKGVEHFFTTRELPLAIGSLDELENVCEYNKNVVAKYLEISSQALISPIQTHSCNITIAQRNSSDYRDIDSLVLSNKNLGIFLNFADCVPVMLWDEKNNIGAIAHAGWRGTAASIVVKTIEFLENYYETKPQNIIAAIGPAISMKNYQVDDDVFGKLKSTLKDDPNDCWQLDNDNKKYNVDLKTINYHQLSQTGVRKIDLCGYCTYDTNDIFFSYRKENGKTARHSAVMKLKDEY